MSSTISELPEEIQQLFRDNSISYRLSSLVKRYGGIKNIIKIDLKSEELNEILERCCQICEEGGKLKAILRPYYHTDLNYIDGIFGIINKTLQLTTEVMKKIYCHKNFEP